MKPPRVLLIEDDEPLIGLLAWLFEDAGFEIAALRSPSEAAERLGAAMAAVVVFNVDMPASGKDRLVTEWRNLAPRSRFIDILIREPGDPRSGAASPFDAVFEMPFDVDDLIEAARSLQV